MWNHQIEKKKMNEFLRFKSTKKTQYSFTYFVRTLISIPRIVHMISFRNTLNHTLCMCTEFEPCTCEHSYDVICRHPFACYTGGGGITYFCGQYNRNRECSSVNFNPTRDLGLLFSMIQIHAWL